MALNNGYELRLIDKLIRQIEYIRRRQTSSSVMSNATDKSKYISMPYLSDKICRDEIKWIVHENMFIFLLIICIVGKQ